MASGTSGQRPATGRGRTQPGSHSETRGEEKGDTSETRDTRTGSTASTSSTASDRTRRRAVRHRPERYLVAVAPPTDARSLAAQLEQDPEITVVRTIGRTRSGGTYPYIAVVETTPARAAALAALPNLYVDVDQPVSYGTAPASEPGDMTIAPIGEPQHIVIEVRDDSGDRGRPVEDAAVFLHGGACQATGFTDANGRVTLAAPIETVAEATVMLVRPRHGCWPVRISRPRLNLDEPTTVVCERIVTTYPDFPERALGSWGARAMGFERLSPTHRAHGVRIAILDSGVAAGHPDLTDRITDGRDVVGQDDKSWMTDHLGAGTHHAVLIAGRDDGTGVVGLAPEAEVHICRIAPGGRCADLIEALDYCIEQQIDVAFIAAGTTEPSRLLAEKVTEARHRGVACVAAAGDGAGPVAYPAALPSVLAVGAVGWLGSFPPDSGYATQLAGPPTPEGFFASRFSNAGQGLDCAGPGVAIVSGLPPASYGPLDGTATAAAHVAAIAALVLAHHPQFRPEAGRPAVERDATRVDHLFEVILASCRPLPQLGPFRSGAGLPDAAIAVGVAPRGAHTPLRISLAGRETERRRETADDEAAATLAPLKAAMRSAGLIPEGNYARD
jgi:subtilisin family serine protease